MDEMSVSFVSVIIPVYNDPLRLKTCLQALEDQTYPKDSYEVIVVDNGSDESIEPIVAEFGQAKASSETSQRGPCVARNKGVSLARGEVIAFTDSDCVPASDWLKQGVTKLQSASNCGIVGGRIDMFFKNPKSPTVVELYDSIMHLNQKMYIEKMCFGVTANLFTYKHLFDRVGDFATNLEMSDDKEWGRRVALSGYSLVYADKACVAHPARYSLAELVAKEIRVARGSIAADREWNQSWLSLTRIYVFIINHLPPVMTTMHLRRVPFRMKIQVIGLWFFVRYLRMKEKLGMKL